MGFWSLDSRAHFDSVSSRCSSLSVRRVRFGWLTVCDPKSIPELAISMTCDQEMGVL